ncbi:MAG TPA: hypothetical protein VFL14_02770 [Xanthomonadales bacterium]|nr:hypothetical protein [Xanthomonadales bacterium]
MTTSVRGPARPWPARAALAVVLAFAALLYAWVPLGHPVTGGFSDSVDYLVLADFFRDSAGGNDSGFGSNYFATSRFPPLYPVTLALGGAGVASAQPAYWVTWLEALLALVAVMWWTWRENASAWAAVAFATVLVLCPGLFLLQLNPISEPLFMALAFAALGASRRCEQDGRWLVFALLVAILPLARMSGVALVLAACAWSYWRLRLRGTRYALAVATMTLPTVAWMAYRRLLPVDSAYVEQLSLQRILAELGGWYGLLVEQWLRLWRGYVELFDPAHGWLAAVGVSALLLLALAGWWRRLRAGRLDALFLPLHVAIVYVWPFPSEIARLLSVTIPILLQSALEALVAWRGNARRDAAAGAIAIALVAAATPALALFASRMGLAVDPALVAHTRTVAFLVERDESRALKWLELRERMVQTIRELPAEVPAGECVYTPHSAFVWFVAQARVGVRPLPPRIDPGPAAREQLAACRWFFVAQVTSPQYNHPGMYPAELVAGWTDPVMVSMMELNPGQRVPVAALLRAR